MKHLPLKLPHIALNQTLWLRIGVGLKAACQRMLNGRLGGEWQGWIGGGRLPPYPGGLRIIWAAALSAEPTLICGPQPHYGLDPHSRLHNATQGNCTKCAAMRARSRRQKEARCAGARWPGAVSAPENWKIAKTGKLGVWSQANRNATIPVLPAIVNIL